MQQANKEKLINLITRPYKALPLCADLPRLGPFMKIFDQNNKVIVDEAAGGANPAIGVLQILTTLANNIEGEESAEKISDSFLPFFAGSDLGTIAITLQRFIEEIMGGDNSHVITVLKCVNQTAISPAIIELKFALGNQCMTKDVKLGWKIEFYLKDDKILIKSRRKEMCIKNTFQYEWTLTFELARGTWQCTDMYIDIISILFHEDCPEDRRGLVKRLLEKYCNNPAVLIMCDKVEYSADAEGNIKVKPRKMPLPLAASSDDVSPPVTAVPAKKPILDSIEKLGGGSAGSSNSSPVGSPRPQPKAILSPNRPRPLKLDEKTESGLRSAGNSFSELQIAKSASKEAITSSDKNGSTNETASANIDSNAQQPSGTTPANGQSSEPSTPVRPQLTLKDSLASLHSQEHVNTVPVPTTPVSPNTPREDLSTQGPASIESINSTMTKEQTKTGSNSNIPSGKKDGVVEEPTPASNTTAENKTEEVLVKRVKLYPNGDRYEGEFNSKGARHGKGVYTTTDGNVYVGEYKDGTRHGKGTYTMHNGSRYEGNFERGVPNGKGVYVFQNGDLYTGDFKDDEFHGLGSWSSMAGATFYGEFKQGRRCGKGVFSDRAGNRYEGEWKDDLMHGYGKYRTANGDVYEGDFKEGKFDGQGVYYFAEHGFKVSGDFQAGKIVKMT